MRGATSTRKLTSAEIGISIHAPHAGRDRTHLGQRAGSGISIHAPHAGRDGCFQRSAGFCVQFQSTRPMRGATFFAKPMMDLSLEFQSTRPMRGATGALFILHLQKIISIHAPHAGRDSKGTARTFTASDFNPRAPCGARRNPAADRGSDGEFQSTRPMRGATPMPSLPPTMIRFQSTRPMRGATTQDDPDRIAELFQSTRPMRGATIRRPWRNGARQYFNPRAPCGARQQKYTKLLYTLLRQKAILRQFHAKRRLLKRFSTYKYRNTFLICSANRMGKICTLPLRTTRSLDLPEGMSACSQSARFCFRTFFPSSKTADYPAPDP